MSYNRMYIMKKNLSLLASGLFFTLSLIFVNPAQAQGLNFNVSNIFSRIGNSVQRFYLKTMPGPKSGQAVLKQSFYQLEQLESFYYEAEINMEETTVSEDPTEIDLTVRGPARINNLYQPQTGQQQLNIDGQITAEGETSNFAAEIIAQEEMLYFRPEDLPSNIGQDFGDLTDQWISLPLETAQTEATTDETASLTQEQQQQLIQATQNLLEQAELSQAKKDSLDGESVFVVDVSLGKEALISYLQEVNRITDQELTAEEKQEMTEQLDQIAPLNLTLWIGQADFYPRQIETSVQFSELETDSHNGAGAAALTQGLTPESGQLQLTVELSQFNQPVEITAPESARPLSEIISHMMNLDFASKQMPDQMPKDFIPETMPPNLEEEDLPASDGVPAFPNMDSLEQQQQQLLEQYGL